MHLISSSLMLAAATISQPVAPRAVADLPDAPSFVAYGTDTREKTPENTGASSSLNPALYGAENDSYSMIFAQAARQTAKPVPDQTQSGERDANGNPIPVERQQPKRILGFMPNFRSVSGGAVPPPPGWKYNFKLATHQAFDYSSFVFLGITSLSAEGINSHPAFGKGVGGAWTYTWHGFLDKTDGAYLGGWFLPSLLHEDTRYYALGRGSVAKRALYVMSRQVVARTYGGHDTPNIANIGGKVLTQVISRTYYPSSAASFSVLATKFSYAIMRDMGFTAIREFYPGIAAHYTKKHREKQLALQAQQP